MNYYHVARINDNDVPIKAGDTLTYYTYASFFGEDNSSTRKTFDTLYPDGISWHGDAYLLADSAILSLGQMFNKETNQEAVLADKNQLIDLIFELIRRAEFPDRLSRLQSMFAVSTKEEAHYFREQMKWSESSPIWEVEAETAFRANMNLLSINGRIIDIYDRARAYWSGQRGEDPDPQWECLLKYPVKIIRQVG